MIYAPVLIPTLCRYNHLLKLLESLSKNSYAADTEIFISVDFPAAEKYQDGYNKLCDMLKEFDSTGFKSFNVFYQENNIGFLANYDFLVDKIKDNYDRYIFTEDDNEFAPNFLEYMDKSLEKFMDDPNVLTINASNNYNAKASNGNVIFSKMFVPYGIGKWIDKENKNIIECRKYLLDPANWTSKNLKRLYKKNPILCQIYLRNVLFSDDSFCYLKNGELWVCDTVMSIYMHMTNKCCLIPALSKSKTNGNDGSGLNMPKLDEVDFEVDSSQTFDLSYNNLYDYDKINDKMGYNHLKMVVKPHKLFTKLLMFVVRLKGRNREKMLKFMNRYFNRKR